MLYFYFLLCSFFSFFCYLWGGLFGMWVFIELAGLCVIPSFFWGNKMLGFSFYGSLLSYIIVMGFSSCLLVSGVLFSGMSLLIYMSFFFKLGVLPFSFWVYYVLSSVKWLTVFLMTVILKMPVLFFSYFTGGALEEFVIFFGSFTLLLCGVLFWCLCGSWHYVWVHMSLSSTSVLLVGSYFNNSLDCWMVYLLYFMLACGSCYWFYLIEGYKNMKVGVYMYLLFFMLTPLSLSLFYKFLCVKLVLYAGLVLVVSWSVYSLSEQFFFYKFFSLYYYPNLFFKWL